MKKIGKWIRIIIGDILIMCDENMKKSSKSISTKKISTKAIQK